MTKLVTIHCNPSALDEIKSLNLKWEYSPQFGKDEIDVIVEDVEFDPDLSDYPDPDYELVDHYGLNYDQVNSIDARNFCPNYSSEFDRKLLSKAYN